jgi:hypothetical protein
MGVVLNHQEFELSLISIAISYVNYYVTYLSA